MKVVAERPSANREARGSGLPARAVERIAAPDDLAHLFGQQLVQVHAPLCHPEIESGDCIEVDFDRRTFRHDGLYLIAIDHEDGARWHGARRFQIRPDTEGCRLWGLDVAAQAWAPVSPDLQSRITVYGVVREVYKPASKLRRAAA
ncbi:hypothetical protein [Acidovorax sp. NCPPB 3576]|uniref:hypothetical protein n=1 Tax=Acidovorax sp. NCPPB 3576 TaxID=2940488 RepID=UPI0023497457|nr:hypothetical protein [Acidovorax sp. NCPPB 3576]WCM88809.1 hypothetical protein M5C98_01780 [Acidovorax sp. NCPPB 3576]